MYSSALLTIASLFSFSVASNSVREDPYALSRRAAATCPHSEMVNMYWPAWSSTQSASQVPFSSADMVFYIAVNTVPAAQGGVQLPAGQSSDDVYTFVRGAHAAGKKAIISFGAWGGSGYFSSNVATAAARNTFGHQIWTMMKHYGFDGIDIDWEFVGQQGIGNNEVSPNDAANLIAFAQALRSAMGSNVPIIHYSVQAFGWTGPDGNPIKSVGNLANYVDFITVMAYDDFQNAWSPSTGPNAALYTCNDQSTSSQGYIKYWSSLGFPACKILLGVPGYSHIFKTASNKLSTTQYGGKSTIAFQDLADASQQPFDPTTVYSKLISNGWLSADGLTGAGGYTRYYDKCTQTPILFNPSSRLFIAYEDAQSTYAKTNFARSVGLAGINFYDSQGLVPATFAAARKGLAGKPQ